MKSAFLILILSLSSVSFGSQYCEDLKIDCDYAASELDYTITLWGSIDTDGIIPVEVLNAENEVSSCKRLQKSNNCTID